MKKLLIFVCLLLIIAIGFSIYVSQIDDRSVYYYKTAESCSNVVKSKMKSPSSYKSDSLSLLVETLEDTNQKLLNILEDSAILKRFYDNGDMVVKDITAYVDYSAKNSFGTELVGNAICEFNSRETKLSFTSHLESVYIGDTKLSELEVALASLSLMVKDNRDIGFTDKLNYFFNASKIKVYEK